MERTAAERRCALEIISRNFDEILQLVLRACEVQVKGLKGSGSIPCYPSYICSHLQASLLSYLRKQPVLECFLDDALCPALRQRWPLSP